MSAEDDISVLLLSLHQQQHKSYDPAQEEKIHTADERPFTCGHCQQSFNRRCDPSRHRGVHSAEKPFICKTCYWRFFTVHQLVNRENMHEYQTPYRCSLCGKRFLKSCYLTLHLKSHTRKRGTFGKAFTRSPPEKVVQGKSGREGSSGTVPPEDMCTKSPVRSPLGPDE
ncbi:hypothetical protein ISCGN_019806 [Ixodes scapularis]